MMKSTVKLVLVMAFIFAFKSMAGQILNPGDKIPAGAIVYSLPVTSLHFEVEAQYESFVAGPYARFAQKYLGVAAREDSGESYTINSVEMTPFVEADPSVNIALNLGNQRNASANFLEMINQGLIVWSDSYTGKANKVRYPQLKSEELFAGAMTAPNLTNEKSTLYTTLRTASGTERVAVQQSQVVEKSAEKRAEEAAALIFNLRTKRLNIITGDTDATFSGDALRAAVEEINRLEDEYLSLFMGKKRTGTQRMSFDIVPVKNNDKQIYIAFRISETSGLMPANNLSGRPVVLELVAESGEVSLSSDISAGKGTVLYRKPAMVNARLMDGQQLLIQSRIPVYQLGTTLSFPLNIATGKL